MEPEPDPSRGSESTAACGSRVRVAIPPGGRSALAAASVSVADLTNACGRKLFARSAFSRRVATVNRQNCIKMGKTWLLGVQMSGPKPKRAPYVEVCLARPVKRQNEELAATVVDFRAWLGTVLGAVVPDRPSPCRLGRLTHALKPNNILAPIQ
jgi:hypothetical protein